MNPRISYRLLKELINPDTDITLMSDDEFDALSPAAQKKEVRRAMKSTGIKKSDLRAAFRPTDITEHKDSSATLMVVTALSMLAGFITAITGLCLTENNEELGGLIVVIGLILAAGVPAVCFFLDRLEHDRTLKRMEKDPKYAGILKRIRGEETADTNFSDDTPPKKVLLTGGTGIALVAASLISLSIFRSTFLGILFGALFFTGFTLLSISFRLSKKRDAAIMMNFPALIGLIVMILHLTVLIKHEMYYASVLVCSIVYMITLLLMPVIFNLIKRTRCTVTVPAKCVSVKETNPASRTKNSYRAVWRYSYNGVEYLHEDISSTEYIGRGDTKDIRINPDDPHDIYNIRRPSSCGLMIVFCAITAFIAFMISAGIPMT
ncbi:MAG: hypothetical protein J5501_02185 [Ruminococcus sp.]|nr:hypothetical protein [Ruminococcus sp.]